MTTPPRVTTPPRDFELLRQTFEGQRQLYAECVAEVSKLSWFSRLLAQPWLAEIGQQQVQLQRMIAQLEDNHGGPPGRLNTAWNRLREIIAALSPAADHAPDLPLTSGVSAEKRLARVAGRLKLVLSFLLLQVIGAVAVLLWAVFTFGRSDPQTALTGEQWEQRATAKAEIGHVSQLAQEWARTAPPRPDSSRTHPDTSIVSAASAAAFPGPDPEALRSEVEALAATLTDSRLAERDLRLANRYLEDALVLLDDADLSGAAKQLRALESAFTGDTEKPVSPILLIVLGSLLGMLVVTIHLNWKFRNRWDTVGFLPWYLTRLIAAPVISLAALGLLFQVSFTTDLTQNGEISGLGLKGANPLTIFAVAVIAGLFSNRIYDWLRRRVESTASPQPARPGAAAPSAGEQPEADSTQ